MQGMRSLLAATLSSWTSLGGRYDGVSLRAGADVAHVGEVRCAVASAPSAHLGPSADEPRDSSRPGPALWLKTVLELHKSDHEVGSVVCGDEGAADGHVTSYLKPRCKLNLDDRRIVDNLNILCLFMRPD